MRHAKEVLANCKKMQALVSSSCSPYKDRTFPSGMNWDDYIHWCLGAMYRLEEEGVGGDLSSGVVTLQDSTKQSTNAAKNNGTTSTTVLGDDPPEVEKGSVSLVALVEEEEKKELAT